MTYDLPTPADLDHLAMYGELYDALKNAATLLGTGTAMQRGDAELVVIHLNRLFSEVGWDLPDVPLPDYLLGGAVL